MTRRVCIFADTINYPEGGGHFWVCLNWALGFRQNGGEVVWMESARPGAPNLARNLGLLREQLRRHSLPLVALVERRGEVASARVAPDTRTLAEAAEQCDLPVNLRCGAAGSVVSRFRVSTNARRVLETGV